MLKKFNIIATMFIVSLMILVTPASAVAILTPNTDDENDSNAFKNIRNENINSNYSQQITKQVVAKQVKSVKTESKTKYINELDYDLASVKNDSKGVYNYTSEELKNTESEIINIQHNQTMLKGLYETKKNELNKAKAELDSFNKKNPLKLTKKELIDKNNLIKKYENAKKEYNDVSAQLKKINTKKLSETGKANYQKLKIKQKNSEKLINTRLNNLTKYNNSLYNTHYTKNQLKIKNRLEFQYNDIKSDIIDISQRIKVNQENLPILKNKTKYLKTLMEQLKRVSNSKTKADANSGLNSIDNTIIQIAQLKLDPGNIEDYANKINNNNDTNKTNTTNNTYINQKTWKTPVISGGILSGSNIFTTLLVVIYKNKIVPSLASNLVSKTAEQTVKVELLHRLNKILGLCNKAQSVSDSMFSLKYSVDALEKGMRSSFGNEMLSAAELAGELKRDKLSINYIKMGMQQFNTENEAFRKSLLTLLKSSDKVVSGAASNFLPLAEASKRIANKDSSVYYGLNELITFFNGETTIIGETDSMSGLYRMTGSRSAFYQRFIGNLEGISPHIERVSEDITFLRQTGIARCAGDEAIVKAYNFESKVLAEKFAYNQLGNTIEGIGTKIAAAKFFTVFVTIIDVILTIYTIASIGSWVGYKLKLWKKDYVNDYINGLFSQALKSFNKAF